MPARNPAFITSPANRWKDEAARSGPAPGDKLAPNMVAASALIINATDAITCSAITAPANLPLGAAKSALARMVAEKPPRKALIDPT
jgi:hypothetical protein